MGRVNEHDQPGKEHQMQTQLLRIVNYRDSQKWLKQTFAVFAAVVLG